MVTFTDNAVEKIHEFYAADPSFAGKAFRIAVDSGGCSGFQYEFKFDDQQDGDTSFPIGTLNVLVDKMSLPFLNGSTVDYVEDFHGSEFKITNPNATGDCGCGKSFSV